MSAKVTLPSVLGSNMVLQQQCNANLWGKAAPSKKSNGHHFVGQPQIHRPGCRRQHLEDGGRHACRRRTFDPDQRRRSDRTRQRDDRRSLDLLRAVEHADAGHGLPRTAGSRFERGDSERDEQRHPDVRSTPRSERPAAGRLQHRHRMAGSYDRKRRRIHRRRLFLRPEPIQSARHSDRPDRNGLGRNPHRNLDGHGNRPKSRTKPS